ncbi:MAG: hypothetical protein CME64_01940 [Halobacteriovoraceae bacterium]|nr:hypothetical protein [Halobacteriovoraceae bacterium]|tara:strand:+ start:34432 stop:34638 length:207 start_codon:yes stop_codon:yes gene_type:complete
MAKSKKLSYAKESELLNQLKIIEESNTFRELGYKTLLKYCVGEFGLSEASAYRRIAASRHKKGASKRP